MLASFFGGPLTAGWMFAWNFSKLGERKKAPVCFLVFLALTIVLMSVLGYFSALTGDVELSDADRRQARFTIRLVAVVGALIVSRMQARRFRIYSSSGAEPAPVLLPAIGVIAAVFVLQAVLVFGVLFAYEAFKAGG